MFLKFFCIFSANILYHPAFKVISLQVLVGNKCDIDESKRAVPYSKGQALANEFGIKFFETSAKSNINVDEVRCHARLRDPIYGLCVLTLIQ